ncbi:uncharacterized protein [Rutidosis leptorrhynchoides]|uniref:uncharacterized protein n=1 Tax=Rutidosis leptorrhynchoides TaxID=125765 RepID=UPI003A99851E
MLKERDEISSFHTMDSVKKCRSKWLQDGDENSSYYHTLITKSRKSQSISGVLLNGVWIDSPPLVKDAFMDFFKSKFQVTIDPINFTPFLNPRLLLANENSFIEHALYMVELKSADEIFNFVNDILISGDLPHGSNSAFITLVPKIVNPVQFKDFRSISLIGSQFKIIAKVLANRVSTIIDHVINDEQSTFVCDRHILDGTLMIGELIEW